MSNCHAISDLFLSFSCLCFLEEKVRPFAHDHRDATSGTTQKLQSNIEFFLLPCTTTISSTRLGFLGVLRCNFVKLVDLKAARDSSGRGWTCLHSTPFPPLICHVFREVPRTGWAVNRGSGKGLALHQHISASTSILTSARNAQKKLTNDELHIIQLRSKSGG